MISVGISRELKEVPVRSLKVRLHIEQKKVASPHSVFLARFLIVVAAQWGQFIRQYSFFHPVLLRSAEQKHGFFARVVFAP